MRSFLSLIICVVVLLHFPPAVSAETESTLRQRAEQGDADAQEKLGEMYEDGVSAVQSDESAAKWYGKAAAQGNTDAQAHLAALRSRVDKEATDKQDALTKKTLEEKADAMQAALAEKTRSSLPQCGSEQANGDVKKSYENGPESKVVNLVLYQVKDAREFPWSWQESSVMFGKDKVRRSCIGIAQTNSGQKYIDYDFEAQMNDPGHYYVSVEELRPEEYTLQMSPADPARAPKPVGQ